MLWCLFVRVNSGRVLFEQKSLLSQKMFVGLLIGIHNLYQRASMISTALFIAMNVDPNVNDSTEFYLILNQMIGDLSHNNKMPI